MPTQLPNDTPGDTPGDTAPAVLQACWQQQGTAWVLHLQGVPGATGAAAPGTLRLPLLPPPPAGLGPTTPVQLNARQLPHWNAALATRLWGLLQQLQRQQVPVDLSGLPDGLRDLLHLATPPDADRPAAQAPAPPAHRTAPRAVASSPAPRQPPAVVVTVAFVGSVLLAVWRALRGRAVPRAAEVLHQVDEAGPRSLGIVALACGLIGLMLAYMGGAQLARMGAQNLLADVVTVGMVRELAGLMTGIILAGRVGSAFAAQLASMQAGEEIDALRVLGVDPITHLVLPRLLGLLLVTPALMAFGALAGVLAGWPAATLSYGLSSSEYWAQSVRALSFTHLWIGLFKGLLYTLLVGLAGCREGLHGGRSAQAVGRATTKAVVKALVWIVSAACLTTVVFTSLGY